MGLLVGPNMAALDTSDPEAVRSIPRAGSPPPMTMWRGDDSQISSQSPVAVAEAELAKGSKQRAPEAPAQLPQGVVPKGELGPEGAGGALLAALGKASGANNSAPQDFTLEEFNAAAVGPVETPVAKGGPSDGKPGESLRETDTGELTRTRDKVAAGLKEQPDDEGLKRRHASISGELARRKTEKSMSGIIVMAEYLAKAKGGPFIGPKGGKWADAKHTIPWKEGDKKPSKTGTAAMRAVQSTVQAAQRMKTKEKDAGKAKAEKKKAEDRARAQRTIQAAQRMQAREKKGTKKSQPQENGMSSGLELIQDYLTKAGLDLVSKEMPGMPSGTAGLGPLVTDAGSPGPGAPPQQGPTSIGYQGKEMPGMPSGTAGLGPMPGSPQQVPDDSSVPKIGGEHLEQDGDKIDELGRPINPKGPAQGGVAQSPGMPFTSTSDADAAAASYVQHHPGMRKAEIPHQTQAEADQAHARQAAAQRRGPADVQIHPLTYAGLGSDTEAADLAKGGGFYNGPDPEASGRPRPVIDRTVLCKGCGGSHTAMLTACPGCGLGTIAHEPMPGIRLGGGAGGVVVEKSERLYGSLLRLRREEDVVIG